MVTLTTLLVLNASLGAGPDIALAGGGRVLQIDGGTLFELNTPWLASGDWKPVRTFPATDGQRAQTTDEGPFGRWTETVTRAAGRLTVRYEFHFAADLAAPNLQWYWRLPPALFDAAQVEGQGTRPVALRPLPGTVIDPLKQVDFVLPGYDLSVTCAASDGDWKLQDVRAADWAKCYRLEYNRAVDLNGKRDGWFEVTIAGQAAGAAAVALTHGEAFTARGVPMQLGALNAAIGAKLAAVLLLQTADADAPRGAEAGRLEVTYADGTTDAVALRYDEAVTAAGDDPRDLPQAALVRLPGGGAAWLSAWRNPKPDVPIATLSSKSLAAGWKLLAAGGIDAGTEPRRVESLLSAAAPAACPEAVVVSLDGTWRFQAAGGTERDIPVPAMWERVGGLRDVHEATYRRTFDVPPAMRGQRVALRFDAIGDGGEVWVNGRFAGEAASPTLPVEFDVTGLVGAPSSGNRVEVRVKDDTHYAVPQEGRNGHDLKYWLPRGIGGNSRKGLIQDVSLVGRPGVDIADVRVQTSFRKHLLTVIYELHNSGKPTVQATLAATVRPAGGGAPVVTLPAQTVSLPGFVTTTVTLSAPIPDGVTWWRPDQPALYTLRSLLDDEAGPRLQRADTRFGFRETWFEGIHFLLNGIRCNLRGESPSYAEKVEMFATREAAQSMVRRFQQVNFNVLRFHALPAPPHVLDVCDELGMMVIDESAIYSSWGMLMPEHAAFLDNCRRHLAGFVRRDRNHPAVVLWSAENEALNVNALTPAMLAEFRRVIDEHDGTRPVTFDGDGTAFGASPASNKHYVSTIADLEERGGHSSGYARDLRSDIYWACAYHQDVPLGCGEFLFPYEPGLRAKEREVCDMMGLQTRGYRLADWYDIRPYNPSYCGFLKPEGVRAGYEEVYDTLVKSFAPVAVFDRDYDALGPFPAPPKLQLGQPAARTLIVYNDTFADESVELSWRVTQGGQRVAGETKALTVPLGGHVLVPITFQPAAKGELTLELVSRKGGREMFRDGRGFVAE